MEAKKAAYPIIVMVRVVGVSCQGYYQWPARSWARRLCLLGPSLIVWWCACLLIISVLTGLRVLVVVLAWVGVIAYKKTIAASLKRRGLEVVLTRWFYRPTIMDSDGCDCGDHCRCWWDHCRC